MDYSVFLQQIDNECLDIFAQEKKNYNEVFACGKTLATYIEQHPEKKELLKEKIFDFIFHNNDLDQESKIFIAQGILPAYSDNESLLKIFEETQKFDNSYNRLSGLYDKIIELNPDDRVTEKLLERASSYDKRGKCDDGLDSIYWRVMNLKPEEKTYDSILKYSAKSKNADSVLEDAIRIVLKNEPSKELIKKIMENPKLPLNKLPEVLKKTSPDKIDDKMLKHIFSIIKKAAEKNTLFHENDTIETFKSLIELSPTNKIIGNILNYYNSTFSKTATTSQKNELLAVIINNTKDDELLKSLAHKKEQMYPITGIKGIEKMETAFENINYIGSTLSKKYPDLPIEEQLIREAAEIIKSGDKKRKQEFNTLILSEGEKRLSDLDNQVMEYLADNLTQENLDAANALRSFYGLKIKVERKDLEDVNLRTTRRMQFDGSVSLTEKESPYYQVQHSKAFIDFVPDKDKQYQYSDYEEMMEKSKAVKTLKKFGYFNLIATIQDTLAETGVPPETAKDFNVKDFQALIIENKFTERNIFDCDNDFLFTKTQFSLEEIDSAIGLSSARSQFWSDASQDKELVKAISHELKLHEIPDFDITQLWDRAEDGHPNSGGRRGVKSVFFQLHHDEALKEGGKNNPNDFVIVVKYANGFSSHDMLHRKDNPLVELYEAAPPQTPQDKIATTTPTFPGAKRIRLITEFLDNDNTNNKTRFYGGPRAESTYRGKPRKLVNVVKQANKLVKDIAKKEKKIDIMTAIVAEHIKKTLHIS